MPKRSAVRCNNSVVLFDNLDKKWWLLVRNFHRSWFGMIVRGAFNAPYFSERQHEKNMSHGKVVSGAGNVNVLLGGAMLGGLILVVFLICYCCHRNMRKSECSYTEYWQEEVEQEMPPNEVFTLDGQCHESLGVFLPTDPCASFEAFVMPHTPTPPPAYDAVVGKKNSFSFDSGLPSYEAALKLEAQGYV